MKKRILTLVIAICMALGMVACGTPAPKVEEQTLDIIGEWELKGVKLNGITQVESDYLDLYDYSFEFTEDGKATVRAMGVEYTTTYEIKDDFIFFAEAKLSTVELKMEEDCLIMEMTSIGGGLVFEKVTE
ncbi:MAG: hypothetical protein IJW63_10515 [Lachnospiraceae bacterium]|nr:hypothetical protein [Lachnospiraceae bacterium]